MIGKTVGRYRIVERLGEGGMGVVFRAEDPRLERDVALKVLKQDALFDEPSKRRLRLEARALLRLLHPNIATLFDFDSDLGLAGRRARVPAGCRAQSRPCLRAWPLRAVALGTGTP
jgi:hypothetical protein